MKVYPEKLAAELKRKVAPIYLVSGDEPLLVQESCDQIRATLKEAGFTERDLFHVEGNFDWDQVLFSASSMSLFAEKKILELRLSSGKPTEKAATALTTYIERVPDDTVMLLVMPRLDAGVQRTKWFKAFESQAVWVQVWPIEVKQMPQWLGARFRRAGLNAAPEAINALIERVEGNLLAAVQEIERLRLLSDNNRITIDDILHGVADSSRYDVFTLLDAALNQEHQRTLRIVRGLQMEGTELRSVVPLLARELRNLANMSARMNDGATMDAALQAGRVWQKRKAIVSRCLKSHHLNELLALQSEVSRIDRIVKGAVKGDGWAALTDVMLQLAGKRVIRISPVGESA